MQEVLDKLSVLPKQNKSDIKVERGLDGKKRDNVNGRRVRWSWV